MTDHERRNITLTALLQAAWDGQKTTLARLHYSHLVRAADEIEWLSEQLKKSQARVRELEAEQGYVMVQSDAEPSIIERAAVAIANRGTLELSLDADKAYCLHGICQEELTALTQSNAELTERVKQLEAQVTALSRI